MLSKITVEIIKIRKYIAILATLLSLTIFIYHIGRALIGLDPLYPFGENMVSYEIVVIPNVVFMKPATMAVIFGYIAVLTTLSHISEYAIRRWNEKEFFTIELVTGTLLFISGYEILFNFTLWSALIASMASSGTVYGNIDLIINTFPNPETPWNVVFATKIMYLIFVSSATSFYYVNKWKLIKREIKSYEKKK
ncbi:MAG TPA: hypothetical protein EYH44_01520 [Thermoprotei archaeon]|nr:hypothetical protein [Thermoprotei archaeon]